MMIQEFEKLTGLEPTEQEYSAIEAMYYDFDGDKKAFCKWFTENDGMIIALREIVKQQAAAIEKVTDQLHDADDTVQKLAKQNDYLCTKLQQEQEWQPYELPQSYKQADYDKLNACDGRKELTDREAVNMIADEFGYNPSKIVIKHSAPRYEKNRHGELRGLVSTERKALFDAWDWNYIRFSVCDITYEMQNGELVKIGDY